MKSFTMALVLAICGIVVPVKGQSSGKNSDAHGQHSADTQTPKGKNSAPSTVNVETVNVNKLNVPQQPEAAGKPDKDSEKSPSYFQRLVAPETLPNTILCLIGIAGVIAAFFTLSAMKEQATLMELQIELSQRPWVSVIRTAQLLHFDPDGAKLGCIFRLENCGGSVAWNVSIWTALVPTEKDWRPELEKLKNITKSPDNAESDYGYVLFPKETISPYQPTILPRKDLDVSIQSDIIEGTGKVGFMLVGCIDYRSHVSPKHYQTAFVDLVGYPDQVKGVVMGAFDPTVKVYSVLHLTPHQHGASAT